MAGRNQGHADISNDDLEGIELADVEEGGLQIDEDIYIPPPSRKSEVSLKNRLVIRNIVNQNFKSYGGDVVLGPFNDLFSSIVGANGSGKSNLIDSILFVFGYRAGKIRSKKLSNLIHKSKKFPDVDSCKVSVFFEEIDVERNPILNSKFIISRTVTKDNSSFYELNGNKVQFKEVSKLLRDKQLDLDYNRFLILQGEVEQIALMKPKASNPHETGMLEFLEDIIGTSRYKEPLEKLADRIELLLDTISEKMNRLKIVENEKNRLREPMQEAINYLKLENSIFKLEYQLFHIKRKVNADLIAEESESLEKLKEELGVLKEELKAVVDEKNSKSRELKEKCKKWDAIQQKYDRVVAKLQEAGKKDENLHAEKVQSNKRKKEIQERMKKEREKLEQLMKVPEKNAASIEECENLVESSTKQLEKEEKTLQNLMEAMQEKAGPLLEERKDHEAELIDLEKKVDEAREEFSVANSSLQLLTSVEQKEKEKLQQLRESYEEKVESLKTGEEEVKMLDKRIPQEEKKLDEASKDLEKVRNREEKLNVELKKKKRELDEERVSQQSKKSQSRVVESLMREKDEGRIKGIFGRLGDLGAIDAKYDVAISTACGPLDFILVDTADTAEICINFLREKNIGRATFISLEKQQKFEEICQQRIETPEGVDRLFDLIQVEERKYLPAFYYALKDTLVAENLEQATRIAYGQKRYRVVTLKGELIELAGTMSGGGRTVLKGRMGQKICRNVDEAVDIEALFKHVQEIEAESINLAESKRELDERVPNLTSGLQEMKSKWNRFEIEHPILRKQISELKAQIKEQQKTVENCVPDLDHVRELQENVKTAKVKLDQVVNDCQMVRGAVKNLNDQIDKVSGGEVKQQQKKIAELKKKIEKAKSEICRLQVEVKTSIKNVEKSEKLSESLENEVTKCQERMLEINEEVKQLEASAIALKEEMGNYSESLAEKKEIEDEFSKQLEDLAKRENEMKLRKVDLEHKNSEAEKCVEKLEHNMKVYTRKIVGLKLNDIPDEQTVNLTPLNDDEIEELDDEAISQELEEFKAQLPEKVPNMQIIKDYKEKDSLYLMRFQEVEILTNKKNQLRDALQNAKKERMKEFHCGFHEITDKLKVLYQTITQGGAADLEYVDSLDPFTEGVSFMVRPPKKSWKNISNLSGGEKTLSSLSLVFALHSYKPTPFYFMDEIDAALDVKNVSTIGNYIKMWAKDAQFIVVSHRREMFDLSDTLVGIYKTYDCAKCVTINVNEIYRLLSDQKEVKSQQKVIDSNLIEVPQLKVPDDSFNFETSIDKSSMSVDSDVVLGTPEIQQVSRLRSFFLQKNGN